MSLNIRQFAEFVHKAKEQEQEEHIRAQWVALLPYMSLQHLKFMPFEDYRDQCTGKNIDMRPADEIIAELEELHHMKFS